MLNKALTNIFICSKNFEYMHTLYQAVLGGNTVVNKGEKFYFLELILYWKDIDTEQILKTDN